LDEFRGLFWDLLTSAHAYDPEPWPEDIPVDPEDSRWEFCFGGMPMFVVANTPAHRDRASRAFDYFAVTFQPRFVFDDLAGGTTLGDNARRIIRQRLVDYDHTPRTPLLGDYGAGGNREWRQYFLDDDNADDGGPRCPFGSEVGR
jgi:FPC/CPF motif-containing protein YcgG